MTSTRLRGWIRKYGDWGSLLVAAYFAGCWLWRKRFIAAPAALLFMGLGICLPPRHKPKPVSAHVSIVDPASKRSVSKREKLPEPVTEELEQTVTLQEGTDTWRLELWGPCEENASNYYLKFYRNSHLITTINAEEMGGHVLELGKVSFATRFPVLVIKAEGLCSPQAKIRLIMLRHGSIVRMMEGGRDYDGPVLHDYDGDGKPEWAFDDYDWGTEQEGSPRHYLIYKEQANGTLKLWKRLPNSHHRRLYSLVREY